MTPEEQQQRDQELKEQARIAEFRAKFDAYMDDRRQKDAQQEIGRDYGDKLPDVQKLEADFKQDARALEEQNDTEKQAFDNWMKEQRDTMRADDAAQRAGNAEPRYVPSYEPGRSGGQVVSSQGIDPNFVQKESLREVEGQEMKAEFDNYQSQIHADRLDTINAQRADNKDRIDEQSLKTATKQFSFESDEQHKTRNEAIANAEVDRVEHARDHGTDSEFMKSFQQYSHESTEQHSARMEATIEAAKRQQEQEQTKTIHR